MSEIGQFVAFTLGGSRYGLDIRSISEIINIVALTPVPALAEGQEQRHWLEGLVNVRGQVIPVANLRKMFSLPVQEPTVSSRILIVRVHGTPIGLIVDSVSTVVEPDPGSICEVESQEGAKELDVLAAIYRQENDLVLLIDLEKLFRKQDMKTVGGLGKPAAWS